MNYIYYIYKMRLKVSLINYLGNHQVENVIENNKKEAKRNLQIFNPNTNIFEAPRAYK